MTPKTVCFAVYVGPINRSWSLIANQLETVSWSHAYGKIHVPIWRQIDEIKGMVTSQVLKDLSKCR